MANMGDRKGITEKANMVQKRLGATTGAAKGKTPPVERKITVRPTGGLKPRGIKAKVVWKF